jgi:rhomboid protease GluP
LSPQEFVQRIHRYTPRLWVTHLIIGANVAVFLAMIAYHVDFMNPTPMQLVAWGGNAGMLSLGQGQFWRLLTSVFVHIGLVHIGMNMLVLWNIGRFVERLVGNGMFLILYLLAGLAGSLASAIFHPQVVSAGASGAIFGLYGVLLGFLLRHRQTIPPQVLTSLRKTGGAFVIYNVLFSVAIPGIDLSAHLGGLVAGFALGATAVAPLTDQGAQSRLWRSILAGLVGLILIGGGAITLR